MDKILNTAVESGLKFPISDIDKESLQLIPNNTFGVFVSVERFHKLPKWPEEIHGCIGNWNDDFSTMDKTKIIDTIKKVSYDATWNDDRRKYFSMSIYSDINSKYKIYFMLNPVLKIDSETGIMENNQKFNNKEYGLIVRSESTRATYLPEVFPNSDWISIKKSILKKASSYNENGFFYAYKSKIILKTIYDYLTNDIRYFFNNSYGDFIPYEVKNNNIIVDKDQDVRNLASMNDILKLKLNNKTIEKIKLNCHYYKMKYLENPLKMRQSAPFLMLLISYFYPNDALVNSIYNFLVNEIKTKTIELNFELGEILMSLACVNPTMIIDLLNKQVEKIYREEKTKDIKFDDEFKYNWHLKILQNSQMITHPYFNHLMKKFIMYNKLYQDKETNFIAVNYEIVTGLLKNMKDNKYQHILEQILENTIIELQKRKDKYGLYSFKDGTSRIDITGHVLNGIYNLGDIHQCSQTGGNYNVKKYRLVKNHHP